MPRLDPVESQEALKERVTEAIREQFPFVGKDRTLRLVNIEVTGEKDPEDVKTQKEAKLGGRTFGSDVKATIELVDNKTGTVIEKSKRKLLTLPDITRRYSYIVGGAEYQIENLWLLKSGIYTRVKKNGELESQINTVGRGFHINFDPKSRKFTVSIGSANPPLYPVMKALGVDDDTLQKTWGADILDANRVRDLKKSAIDFANRLSPRASVTTFEQAQSVIQDQFSNMPLRPDVTQRTIGKPVDKLTPEAMVLTTHRLLDVARGGEPDDRDSLMYKELHGVEDFLARRINDMSTIIKRRVSNNIDRPNKKIGDIVIPDLFERPVKQFFTKSSLANASAEQTNPLNMIMTHQKTTISGDEGGIKSEHQISAEAKLVNPSHFGFLDALHTPENEKTGVTLHTTMGLRKEKNKVTVPLYNIKTGKMERVTPDVLFDNVVVMPDEVVWKGGKPVPKADKVTASLRGNELGDVRFKDAKYVMPAANQVFSIALNLVPYLANNSQNRATMSGRHQEQAVALKYREIPQVQSAITDKTSFDEAIGKFTAQNSPISGVVRAIRKDAIVIESPDGVKHSVPIYDNYPLNEKKGFLHSDPVVKEGQKIKKGDLIADTTFTKNGVYAPGINLRVAYLPMRGYNIEDAVVISESAAKKLTSEHLYKKKLTTHEGQAVGVNKYVAYYPTRVSLDQRKKLGDDGVIRVGQTVEPGDTVIAALSQRAPTSKEDIDLSLIHKSLVKPYDDRSVVWEEEHPGKVIAVHRRPKAIEVHIKTEEPAIVGDKIVSRHANKGIISSIIPDHEMPKTKDNRPVEVIHNPIGVPGRMNVGQILETASSKIAEKTGKPVLVKNFSLDDARSHVEKELKKHNLSDKEVLIDPKTGKELPPILVGNQYTLKLHHQVEQKMSSRSRDSYDRNLAPKGGLPHGGQSIGSLELYGLLAHGAKHNIRETATYRADKAQGGDNDALWTALQTGELLPPPRPTFAYQKFLSYLKALGVNVEKDGNSLNLSPLTDKEVLALSSGQLKNPAKSVMMRTLAPERGGIFDPKITGGEGGTKWSHFTLHEPMPNPLFERAIMSVSGVKKPQFDRIIAGEDGVTSDGNIVGPGDAKAIYGPSAVSRLLRRIDVDKELRKEETRIGKLRGQQLNETNKRIKILRALKKAGLEPHDAYMMQHVPVLPPVMRPLSILPDGNVQFDPLNHLYKQTALSNMKLGSISKLLPDEEKAKIRSEIYDELKALSGTGGSLNRKYPGILDIIAGSGKTEDKGSPKEGFFQDKLMKRRQDLSLRSTIVPDPAMSLDEVGIPRKAAMEMYKPFVVRKLKQSFGMTPGKARRAIEENTDLSRRALEVVVEERPLIMKRDPVLHRYGIQGFKPKLIEGKAIKIHPLVTSGFNADFDGDAMSAFVPISNEAIEETRRMMPSNLLFSPATGRVEYTPKHEMQVGLFGLTEVGKRTRLKFKNRDDVAKAVKAGTIEPTDVIKVGDLTTTAGRLQIDSTLPEPLRGGPLLKDLTFRLTKSNQSKLFESIARYDPKEYPRAVDALKNAGNEHAYMIGFSIGLEDLAVHKDVRDKILRAADKEMKGLDPSKKGYNEAFVKSYSEALVKLEAASKERAKKINTHLDRLEVSSGIKGNAYRQLTASPVLFTDAANRVVLTPVRKSYAEGLGVAGYWSAASGGRKGILQKVQTVSEPGYLSKLVMNATMNQLIQSSDCGTSNGVSLSTEESDVVGRYLQADVKTPKGVIKRGTLITPDTVAQFRNAKVSKIVVRSPLKCNDPKGICAKCFGLNENGQLHDPGTNVGVLASQALGERGVQLSMRRFHSGGVYDPASQGVTIEGLDRAKDLLKLPQVLKGSATLSTVNGKVQSVKRDPAGGYNILIEGKRHYVPSDRKLLPNVKSGVKVDKGAPLTTGPINPHDMLPLTGITPVQNYVTSELHKLYQPEGIRRRNTEVVVRAMGNVTRIEDPGDYPDLIRGDFVPTTLVQHINRTQLKGKKPIRHTPIMKGVNQIPHDVMEDWLARLNHERLKETVIDAAQKGWSSKLHGEHPVPAYAYGAEFGTIGPVGY